MLKNFNGRVFQKIVKDGQIFMQDINTGLIYEHKKDKKFNAKQLTIFDYVDSN